MTTVTLTLDAEALREGTMQAIMGVLTPEMRNKLIESSIQAILAPSTNSWDKKASAIEIAFNNAVDSLARTVANDMVKSDPELRTRLEELMKKTFDKMLTVDDWDDTKGLPARMADAFISGLAKGR
jgi:hypothetical protein